MERLSELTNGFTMPPLTDLLMATPRLDVQITLAIIHTIFWYFLINHIFVPIGIRVISNLKSKKRFIHFNRESFKKMIKWDIGDDEEEQIIAIARIDAAMVEHLVAGTLCLPSVLGFGYMLPVGVASAMARHGILCELGWEVEDTLLRIYEIIFCGERGRKLNPLSLMLTLFAHHSAAWCLAIPMNTFYPNQVYLEEAFCIVSFGSFITLFMQQYGYTLNAETQEGLNKIRISVLISLLTVIWTRIIRYAWLWKKVSDVVWEDENWTIIKLGLAPSILLALFNIVVLKDAAQKFIKFVSMDIKKRSKRNIQETIKKMGNIKDLATKSASAGASHMRNRKLYTGVSAEDIFMDY